MKKPDSIIGKLSSVKMGAISLQLNCYEALLSGSSIINGFTESEKIEVIKSLLQKMEKKKKRPDIYSEMSFIGPAVVIAKLISSSPHKASLLSEINSKELSQFVETGRTSNENIVTIIGKAGNKYIE